MAVKTLWPVEHVCGHEEDHDLSAKRPSEPTGYGRRLAGKGCSACWRAEQERANSKERETWQAERRADEAAAIETWEHAAAMPPLRTSRSWSLTRRAIRAATPEARILSDG